MKRYLIVEGDPPERYWGAGNKSAKKKCSKTLLMNAFINRETAEEYCKVWNEYGNNVFRIIEIEGECTE